MHFLCKSYALRENTIILAFQQCVLNIYARTFALKWNWRGVKFYYRPPLPHAGVRFELSGANLITPPPVRGGGRRGPGMCASNLLPTRRDWIYHYFIFLINTLWQRRERTQNSDVRR